MKSSRRRVSQIIGLAGITAWTKPIVNSSILPAHAGTTGSCIMSGPTSFNFVEGVQPPTPVGIFTITNSGPSTLTGAVVEFIVDPVASVAFSSLEIGGESKQEELPAGATGQIEVLAISFNSCAAVNGLPYTVRITFNETSCEVNGVITCSSFG